MEYQTSKNNFTAKPSQRNETFVGYNFGYTFREHSIYLYLETQTQIKAMELFVLDKNKFPVPLYHKAISQ